MVKTRRTRLSTADSRINIGGNNTFDGTFTLNGPVLTLRGPTVSGTGSIIINGSTSSITSRLNLGPVNVNVPVDLQTNLNIDSPNGNNPLRFNGALSGDSNLIKKGNGVAVIASGQHLHPDHHRPGRHAAHRHRRGDRHAWRGRRVVDGSRSHAAV